MKHENKRQQYQAGYYKTHPCRDSFIGMALVLQYMAETGKTISELVDMIPRYFMVKKKVQLTSDQIVGIVEQLKNQYAAAHIDVTDGLKIFFDERKAWAHIRPSNTEPILRVMSEATSKQEAEELNDKILAEISQALKSGKRLQ